MSRFQFSVAAKIHKGIVDYLQTLLCILINNILLQSAPNKNNKETLYLPLTSVYITDKYKCYDTKTLSSSFPQNPKVSVHDIGGSLTTVDTLIVSSGCVFYINYGILLSN